MADIIYEKKILQDTVVIEASDLNVANIDNLILTKLVEKLKNKCTSNGIVNYETIELRGRSLGSINSKDTYATINYIVKYEADICCPYEGQLINCIVDQHTDAISICYVGSESDSPLEIHLSKQNMINNKEYINLKPGDKIQIKVMAYLIETNNDKIMTIGEFIKKL